MESEDIFEIGYWDVRGLVRHVMHVAEYVHAPYKTKLYAEGEDGSGKDWFDQKYHLGLHFPNIPYLRKGDFNITETLVIIHYLWEKFKPELLGETAQEKAIVMMLAHISHQVKIATATLCFTQNETSVVLDKAWETLKPVSEFLGEKKYLLGDKLWFVDIYLLEFFYLIDALDPEGLVNKYPNLSTLKSNVENLPEIKDFLESERNIKLPFFGPHAQINP